MKYTTRLSLIALCTTSASGIALPEPLPQGSPGIEYWNFTCTAPQTGGCCLYQWGSVPVSYSCRKATVTTSGCNIGYSCPKTTDAYAGCCDPSQTTDCKAVLGPL